MPIGLKRPTRRSSELQAILEELPPALRPLAEALAPVVASLIQEQAAPTRLVDIVRVYPISRRLAYRACRQGRIPGAVRVARRWLAPPDAVETWLQAQGPRPVAAVEDEGDDLDELRAALARGMR